MLEARIVWPDGSFYFAAEATPYDLETLAEHLRDLADGSHGDVRLDVMLANAHNIDGLTTRWLTRLAHAGVHVSVNSLFFPPVDAAVTLPVAAAPAAEHIARWYRRKQGAGKCRITGFP